MNNRRLMRMSVTPEFFATLCSSTTRVTANPLPADARIVSSYYDGERDEFGLVISSEEYPYVVEGNVIPLMLSPAIERLR